MGELDPSDVELQTRPQASIIESEMARLESSPTKFTNLPAKFLRDLENSASATHSTHSSYKSSFRRAQPTPNCTTGRRVPIASVSSESYIPVGCLRIHREDTSLAPEVWESCNLWSSFAYCDNPAECGNEVILAKEVQDALSIGLKRYGYSPSRKDLCKYKWVRMEFKVNARDLNHGQVRVFVLPDDIGRTHFPREDTDLRRQLFSLLQNIDISPDTFAGSWNSSSPIQYIDPPNWNVDEVTKELSLLHIFNHLPSPNPEPCLVKEECSSEAMQNLMENDVRGLRADLFSFQGRTAAMMLQREAQPSQHLDPRLRVQKDQTGTNWYFNKITGEWLRNPRFVDDPRGGILAEHMGRGKTLICLALIMATRGNYSSFPVENTENKCPVRKTVGSLIEMAAAAAARSSIPWKSYFEKLLDEKDEDYGTCVQAIRNNPSFYTVHPPVRESSRRSHQNLLARKIYRASTTIVVVPPNLVDQWLNEIEKHTFGLKVLVMKETKMRLPPPIELIEYDLILFSRLRLEKEFRDGVDQWSGARNPRPFCGIGNDEYPYSSPLLGVHFKRIITDEGHFIGNSGGRSASKAVQAMNVLAVDSRWVVSGTPTQGLYGIENNKQLVDRYNGGHVNATENDHKQQRKDVEKIGNIATGFLKAQPWTSDHGSWQKFNMQVRYGETDSFSYGDPECLRAIMENIVLRTRAEDVESEIALPELHQKFVYLEASVQDAISLNIFVLNIISNAVTSERKDADYFFHVKHRTTLNDLVRNLRQATFFWSGWTVEKVLSTMDIANEFLVERKTPISDQDEALLRTALAVGENILRFISHPEQRRPHLLTTPLQDINSAATPDSIFEAASATDEIPIYVRNELPSKVRMAWALDKSDLNPTLFGLTQLKALRDSVISQLWKADPIEGLREAGMKATENCREPGVAKSQTSNVKDKELPKNDSPTKKSSKPNDKKGSKRVSPEKSSVSFPQLAGGATVGGNVSPRKPRRHGVLRESNGNVVLKRISPMESSPQKNGDETEFQIKSAMKKTATVAQKPTMDPESKLASAEIESTASAKLTYLVTQILAVKDEEKSIIFYEEETVGYYIAQALEAIGVEYLIYAKAKTLSSALQSRWLRKFADEDGIRVLLMDLGAGTFGLDVSCASRVFFVNPVFNPQVEAQAIKRAHRIGQTRPVYVEILVMKGSMEEKIVERRKQLSDGDFSGFKTILDDDEMYEWVKNPRFLPLPDAGESVLSNIPNPETMAKLPVPHRIFGSLIRGAETIDESKDNGVRDSKPTSIALLQEVANTSNSDPEPPTKKKKKTVGFI